MALYISIEKSFEDNELVEYTYIHNLTIRNPEHEHGTLKVGEQFGKVLLDKLTGEMILLQSTDSSEWYYDRVCYMIKKAFNKKIYPQNIDFMA